MGELRLAALVCLLAAAPAHAAEQYFGRNKVEYTDFDFRILTTEHFDVYYYPREERAARIAARLAERWYSRISTALRHQLDRRQPLVVYGSQAEFAQTNVVSGLLSDSVGGVTEGARRRIVIPFAPTMAETNRVLGHEIAHAFQYDLADDHGGMTQPLWFIEGMAEYLARGGLEGEGSLWLRDAVRSRRIPRRQRDAAGNLSPYLYGHAFWSWMARRFGDDVIVKALTPPKKQRKLDDRMRYATGETLEALHTQWRASLPKAAARGPEERLTRAIGGRMQLGPAISPDGRQAVFFSERDRLSLDLYLADLDSGRVLRKLATTAATARFDSLQPLRSAGAWSPDGARFVFPAVRHGQATLVVMDMRNGGPDREITFKDLGQVLAPAWSPDGSRLVFSAIAGGFTDLYLYDFGSGALTQLTDDAVADLQPAWSHDGRTIAFVTERYSTDLEALRFGRPRLALMDAGTHAVRQVALPSGTSEVNPQWSADDRGLFYIGDAGGIPNVYRVDTVSLNVRQVTAVATGVSGVTPTSPALSVAGGADTLAFTLYEDGRPQLVVLDPRSAAAAARAEEALPAGTDHDEPAAERSADPAAPGLVDRLLADDQTGLPDAASVGSRDYASRLSLEGISPPYFSAGGGPFGTFVRGGGALLFGDMLSERRLGAAVQFGNRLQDAAFAFRFLNQQRRWNWGAIAELEPGLGRSRRAEVIERDGEPAVLKQTDYLQRMQLRAAGLVAYPFSRGLRVEFTGGVRHAIYRRDLRSQVTSPAGKILSSDRVESSGGDPTTVAEIGAAIVGDTSVFGPTGPLLGSRYRFEVIPATGGLTYTRIVADYRRYLMPVRPYTVALRVMHSARYGPDGDDPRLLSSFLGSSYLVRGHRLDQGLCHPDPARPCADALVGNRLLVGNLEVRFPVWGVKSRQIEYGPLPADAFVFVDGGLVSTGSRRATGISSAGGGLRVNAGGLPFEVVAMRALDGPVPRWQFDFGFRVGF